MLRGPLRQLANQYGRPRDNSTQCRVSTTHQRKGNRGTLPAHLGRQVPDGAPVERESPVHRNILDNMRDGVMSVYSDGRIMTFNPAASALLGIAQEEALGRTFAEVLLAHEGLDDFNQALLDVVQAGDVGRQREVSGLVGGRQRTFALTTSYLREGGGDSQGVVVVFTDVTEVKSLRETEQRLAQQLEAQNEKLQTAYRELEENNATLSVALRKVQVTRVAATVFVIGLFLAVGLATWFVGQPEAEAAPVPVAATTSGPATIVVEPRRLVSTIVLFGRVAPLRETHVASPVDGKVADTHFMYGERVAKEELLVNLDTTEVERELRQAQAEQIRTQREFEALQNWESNPETARVRRELSKAKLSLDNQRSKVEQSALLLEEGIVAAVDHEAAMRQYRSQTLDYESLQEDYATVLAKGDEEAQEVARLERDNARVRVASLREVLQQATILAPIAGVVLQPASMGRNSAMALATGRVVSQGERLLTVGDVDELAVLGWVDEVDVTKVRPAQPVTIRGDAFPGLELSGSVARVSRQARQGGGSSTPTFEIAAAIDPLSDEVRPQLRLGMSARIEVVVADKPDALLVPIGAVDVSGDGSAWLRVKDAATGATRRLRVTTGPTTLTDVEIMSGVAVGDEVVVGT